MKKVLLLLMALCMTFTMFGCSAVNNAADDMVDAEDKMVEDMKENENNGVVKDNNGIIGDEDSESNKKIEDQAEKDTSTAEYANDAEDGTLDEAKVKNDVKE